MEKKKLLFYIKPYLFFCLLAQLSMVGEVFMELMQPELMRRIVNDGVLGLDHGGVGDLRLVFTLGTRMIAFVVIGGIFGICAGTFSNIAGQGFANLVRKECFRKIVYLSFEQTDRFSTGSLVTRMTNDVTQVQNIIPSITRGGVRALTFFAGGIYCVLRLNLSFGVVIACALPPVVATVVWFLWKAAPVFTQLQKRLDQVNNVMQENISGARVVKAYVQGEREKSRFSKVNQDLADTQLKTLAFFSCMSPIMNIVMNAAAVGIIYVGGIQVKAGAAALGDTMAAITYSSQILNSILTMTMIFQNLTRGLASAKRLAEVLESSPSIQDGGHDVPKTEEGKDLPEIRGRIEFRNVSFAYPNAKEPVLRQINLIVEPGETLGIMGATGSGKTSLVSLIPRFYDVTEGQILVDGMDVRNYRLKDLRDKISVALQESELFYGTLKENIALGRPETDDAECLAAAEIAQAAEFIEHREGGLSALLGQRGSGLSGGQRQRVAISRSVIRKSEILIFDDATSALDLKTEAALYAALRKSAPGRTKIIVAQRVATVMDASRIAVLDGGRIIACAGHEELLQSCQVYRDIYDSQMKGGEQIA